MDIQSYKKLLSLHDWNYENSDDHSIYRKGRDTRAHLYALASRGSPEMKRAYNEAYSENANTQIEGIRLPFHEAGLEKLEDPF